MSNWTREKLDDYIKKQIKINMRDYKQLSQKVFKNNYLIIFKNNYVDDKTPFFTDSSFQAINLNSKFLIMFNYANLQTKISIEKIHSIYKNDILIYPILSKTAEELERENLNLEKKVELLMLEKIQLLKELERRKKKINNIEMDLLLEVK